MNMERQDIETMTRLSEQVAQVRNALDAIVQRLDAMPQQWAAFLTRAEHEVHVRIMHDRLERIETTLKAQSLMGTWERVVRVAVGITAIVGACGAIIVVVDYLRHRNPAAPTAPSK